MAYTAQYELLFFGGNQIKNRQKAVDCHPDTARDRKALSITTWNVRTLHQKGKPINQTRGDKIEDKYNGNI